MREVRLYVESVTECLAPGKVADAQGLSGFSPQLPAPAATALVPLWVSISFSVKWGCSNLPHRIAAKVPISEITNVNECVLKMSLVPQGSVPSSVKRRLQTR